MFSSVQSLGRFGCRGDMTDNSAEILFHGVFFFCLFVFYAGGLCELFWDGQGCPLFDVHPAFPLSTTASPTLQGGRKNGFGGCHGVCPHHVSFHVSTVASRGFCGPRRKLILLRTQSLIVLVRRSFLMHLASKEWVLFFSETASRVHVSQP